MANAQMCPCEFGDKTTEKALRNEIGINTLNVNEALINFTSPGSVLYTNYANGIMYKHHFDKFSLRAGFDYFENTYSYEAQDSTNYNLNNGKSFGKSFRAGLEKTLFFGKLQAFAAIDLIYTNGRYSGNTKGHGDKIAPYDLGYGFNYNSFGFSPAIGIKYRPFRRFSISAETSLSALYYKTSNSVANPAYPSESSIEVLFNPLRLLSVNFHF